MSLGKSRHSEPGAGSPVSIGSQRRGPPRWARDTSGVSFHRSHTASRSGASRSQPHFSRNRSRLRCRPARRARVRSELGRDSSYIFQPKGVTRAFSSNVIARRESRDRAQLSWSREEQLEGASDLCILFFFEGKLFLLQVCRFLRLSPRTRPAGLQRSRGPLGKCSTCDVLPANLKVKVGGDERETESHGWDNGGEGPGGRGGGGGPSGAREATMSKCTSAA
jgi:hypothetical protein